MKQQKSLANLIRYVGCKYDNVKCTCKLFIFRLMKATAPVYTSEVNELLEQVLGFMQNLVRSGEKEVLPFYIIFPARADSELHQFEFEVNDPSLMMDMIDLHLSERAKKKPAPKYAIIGYTFKKDRKSYIGLEAYSKDAEGFFAVTQGFRLAKGVAAFSKEAELEFYAGHNPLLQILNRGKIRKKKFKKM